MSTSFISGQVAITLGILWFLLNFYSWFYPKARRKLIETRGPLLGFGFAFGAAFIGATVDGFAFGWDSFWSWLSTFFIRFLLLLVPFIYPFVRQLPRQAQVVDMIVVFYGLFLLQLPRFTAVWIDFSSDVIRSTIFPHIGSGNMALIGLFASYFFGVRWWSEMVMDVRLRKGDVKNVGLAVLGGLVGAVVVGAGAFVLTGGWDGGSGSIIDGRSLHTVFYVLFGLVVAVPFEVFLFRTILQCGLLRLIPARSGGAIEKIVPMVTVSFVALLHAFIGAYALPPAVAFGLSLGVGLSILKHNRFLPALLGHAIVWLLLIVGMAL